MRNAQVISLRVLRVGIVIPALNEAGCISDVVAGCLSRCPAGDTWRVVVCDNASTDATATVAAVAGAEVIGEARRGYGAACLRALRHLGDWPDAVLFADADGSSDLDRLGDVLAPLRCAQADLVIGWRCGVEPGAMTATQHVGNRLACALIRWRFGTLDRDLGPLRALSVPALRRLRMSDRTWGWTMEMQIKAVLSGLRVVQVPVCWRRRAAGESKISGSLRGALRAGAKILWTFTRHGLQPRRCPAPPPDVVVEFVRYPQPGAVKTRLAAGIGAERAARVYRRLASRTHHQLLALQAAGFADVAVFGDGGDVGAFRRWLPGARHYWRQPGGASRSESAQQQSGKGHGARFRAESLQRGTSPSGCIGTVALPQLGANCGLGERLSQAFTRAFGAGARRVAAVGSDCADLDGRAVTSALAALHAADVSLIPAADGGYALIAMRRPWLRLFEGIDWSTAEVADQTRRRAAELGLSLHELAAVCDVDTAADLQRLRPLLSIIVPVLDDQEMLRRHLPGLMAAVAAAEETVEVIVVDGGSQDDSAGVARDCGAVVLPAGRGRAVQMNAGARQATGEWLLFLHADCALAHVALDALLSGLIACADRDWGYFPARIAATGAAWRLIEWGIAARCRAMQLPFGDQGIFVRRDLFEALGGYVEEPILEDAILAGLLRRCGPPIVADGPLLMSARRWQQQSAHRTTWTHVKILYDYYVRGRSCAEIARCYRSAAQAAPATAGRGVLLPGAEPP